MRCLCAGDRRAKTLTGFDRLGQLRVGHRFDLAAEQNFFAR